MVLDPLLAIVGLQTILLATTSACILFVADARHRKPAMIWVFSNVLAAMSLYSYPSGQPDAPTLINAANSSFSLIGAYMKYLCLDRQALRRLERNPALSAAIGIPAILLIIAICSTRFRLLLLCAVGFALSTAALRAISRNRTWRGLPAKKLMLGTFGVSSLLLVWRVQSAYPIGRQSSFIGGATEQVIGLALLISVTVFMQIGFLGLITGRMDRLRQRSERRTASIASRSRTLMEFNHHLEQAAHERLVLLELLTHEVRQPLNNAQAAIETVLGELGPVSSQARNGRLHGLVLRTQAILDSITLALSNSIVGASLLQRSESGARHATEFAEVARLAAQDCPTTMQHRIRLSAPAEPVFVMIDPGLMRLAMRNLMDNAIKYSPAGSAIDVEIALCEERLGVTFSVSNNIVDASHLEGNIFALKVRGNGQIGEGQGIGLYVVSQVARIHHGTGSFSQPAPGRVRFELFLPL